MSKKTSVLVVDDEEGIRDLFSDILAPRGYTVLCAESGAQAIDTLAANRVDVVFLDIRMPSEDGLSVLSKIQERWSQIPVIMITGCAQREVVDKTLDMGAYACLVKPFGMREVVDMLEVVKAA